MSSRERWTVYPLLFLAIGLAFRAVAVPPDRLDVRAVETETLTCGEIVVTSQDGVRVVHIGRVKGGGGGRVEINDQKGVEAIAIGTSPGNRDGGIEFFDAAGRQLGRLVGTMAVPVVAPGPPVPPPAPAPLTPPPPAPPPAIEKE
jgi:hypothetical protein